MNQTVKQIYEDYRDEMAVLLSTEERTPQRFANIEFVEHFEQKVDRLDTLINLFADIMSARKKKGR